VALVGTLGLCESVDMEDFLCMHGPHVLLGQGAGAGTHPAYQLANNRFSV